MGHAVTPDQFAALAQLLRLRPSPTLSAVELHLVQGLSVPDAARQAGAEYQLVLKAAKRAKDGLALARQACGLGAPGV